ncbi:family 43 glycosylhydrolase [Sphingomonas sp. ASV193]|uniref:family 43 glycosylhydrolase n=1 Tax=Sphingomonas sp. ASV193 TaxID=3144405 RepID=UPI0032E913E0
MRMDRRDMLASIAGGAALSASPAGARAVAPARDPWRRGIEGQRIADLGDGRYRNPIVGGDHPDPTIVRDGADYYMTFSSFEALPGVMVWHSRDLVNWRPLGPALTANIGSVWACDIGKHDGRFFIYMPVLTEKRGFRIFVTTAARPEGPWSEPVDIGIDGCIDPGHVVGEDGHRYLFVNGIRKVRLSDDGSQAVGPVEPAYQPWHYPADWIVEDFAPEGPKLLKRGGYFYLVTAVGGTAGPPTGHMIIVARSRSVHGPWENCPYNPVVRTVSEDEPWWSRGHGTPVEGPAGDWWIVYHGYENGYRPLGRQALLEPVEWTADGWLRARGGDLSRPIPKPRGGVAGAAGMALSDDFRGSRLGPQWSFHHPGAAGLSRTRFDGAGMLLAAAGSGPGDSAPLTITAPDRDYAVEVSFDLSPGVEAGLTLFYNFRAFVGVGFDGKSIRTYTSGERQPWMDRIMPTRNVRVRMTNVRQVATFYTSLDEGRSWQLNDLRTDVTGYNHNTFGGFLALRPAIYASGAGSVRLRDFRYRALG